MLAKTPLHEVVDRTTLESWRKVLLDAADLIAERGLAKFTQEDDQGRLCAAGAMSVAVTGKPYCNHDLYKQASFELCHMVCPKHRIDIGPAYWNNKPERTADEVISAMRTCALQGVSAFVW